jgi:hypothetical protein
MARSETTPGMSTWNAGVHSKPKAKSIMAHGPSGEEIPAEPRLTFYYADSRVKPVAFIKAVRAEKSKSFGTDDTKEALRCLTETDPTLSRTIALVGKGPDAVGRWVIDAAKASLKHYTPEAVSDEHCAANVLFDRVVRACAGDLAAKDKQCRARAQNLIRLALVWLIDQRNLSPINALLSVRKAKKKKNSATAASASRDAIRLLTRTKLNQLLNLSLIATLFEASIARAAKERQESIATLSSLRDRINILETKLQTTNEELEKTAENRDRLSEALAIAQKELSDEKKLHALECEKRAGSLRTFLTEQLSQPLSDARDALDFDPPHADAARQRIEMAMSAIGRELEKIDE